MRKIIFCSFLLMQTSALHASWEVEIKTDSMTDEEKKTAKVINEEGHSIAVYRLPNGTVWVNFSLSSRSLNQLSPQKPPVFRIDKNKPHDIANEKQTQEMRLGIEAFAWEPKWINFLIWHGKESEGRSHNLRQLMQGETIVFRYHLFTGGYKETSFSLEGAGPAIADALGISIDTDKATTERIDGLNSAYLAASKICQENRRTFRTCFEKLNSCRKQSNNELASFQLCMK